MKKRGTSAVFFAIIILIVLIARINAITYNIVDCTGNNYGANMNRGLQWIPNDYAQTYNLMNDIDCNAYSFESIGDGPNPFTGIFDGQGHKIKNLKIVSSDQGGLFAATNGATIKNLVLEDINIYCGTTTGCTAGGLAGVLQNTNINQVAIDGGMVYGYGYVGGLAGYMYSSNIINSYAYTNPSGSSNTGGFIGYLAYNSAGSITNCYTTGPLNMRAGEDGGFIGGKANGVVTSFTSNYWDTTTNTGHTLCDIGRVGGYCDNSPGGITQKTTAQMKQQATYSGWDFTNVWHMYAPDGTYYPILKIQECPTGQTFCGALECKDLQTDPNACGFCTRACSAVGINHVQTRACVGGKCSFTCDAGWKNCNFVLDPNPDDGCEADITTSISNCGDCGIQCTNAHGTTQCTSGVCNPICSSGWKDCDGNPNNGCETDITSISNCGDCGIQCTGAQVCKSGTPYYCSGIGGANWYNMKGNIINTADLNDLVKLFVSGFDLTEEIDYEVYRIGGTIPWFLNKKVAQKTTAGFLTWRAGFNNTGNNILEGGSYYFRAKLHSGSQWVSTESNPVPYKYLVVSDNQFNNPPFVNITIPHTGEVFLTTDLIEFNQSSYDEDDVIDYVWNIGDGKILGGDSINYNNYSFDYNYALPGQKRIHLDVVDDRGARVSDEKTILVVNKNVIGNYTFAFISGPEWGRNVTGPLVKCNATESFALEVYNNDIKCLGGKCPSQTSGETPVPISTPYSYAVDGYGKNYYEIINFSWTFDDGDKFYVKGANGTNFTKIYGTPNEHSAKLEMIMVNNVSSYANTWFRVKLLNFCEKDGLTWWDSTKNSYSTLNNYNPGCAGLNLLSSADDCCPTNYVCTIRGCELDAAKQAFCKNVFFCADYSNSADCAEDKCRVGCDLSCGNIKSANESCKDDLFVKTNCLCNWNAVSGKCELKSDVRGSIFIENNEVVYSCDSTLQHGTCLENGFMRVDKVSVLNAPSGCNLNESLCPTEQGTVLCGAARIRLPFFNFINFIISFILITAIYAIISWKKS